MTRRQTRRGGMLIGAPVLAAVVLPGVYGGSAWMLAAAAALCLTASAIAVHDLTSMLIPDRYTLAFAVIAVLVQGIDGGIATVAVLLATAVAVGASLFLVDLAYGWLRSRSGIGFGDIKLLSASTLLVGLSGVGMQVLLATTAALIFVVIRAVRRQRPLRATARIPFGAFLAPAAVIVWAWFPTP